MSFRLIMCLVGHCVVRRRIGTICSFNAIIMVDYGSWYRSGLVLLRLYMAIYIYMLISFVLLEVSERTLIQFLLLFGLLSYLLYGKIAIGEFSKTTMIIFKLFLKGLRFKCIGGWKQTSSCSLLITPFGDKTP